MAITYERLIYTAGTIKLTDELRECRRILIYTDVLRKPPSAIYQNERMNPPKGFLGYVSLMIDDYVVKVFPLEYEHQLVLEWDNLSYQVFKTVVCTGALVIDAIVALGSVMTPPAVLIPTTPDPPSFPGCPYVWLKFKLEPLTRIKVTAFGEETIGCDGGNFTTTVPDLPPPPSPYPPTQALDEDPPRSDPYPDENPGDTAPPSADDPDSGLVVSGTWTITFNGRDGSINTDTYSGVSTDVFTIESPGRDCSLSGSSQLVRNGTEILNGAFNCNPFGFVSTLLSQTFTPD